MDFLLEIGLWGEVFVDPGELPSARGVLAVVV